MSSEILLWSPLTENNYMISKWSYFPGCWSLLAEWRQIFEREREGEMEK